MVNQLIDEMSHKQQNMEPWKPNNVEGLPDRLDHLIRRLKRARHYRHHLQVQRVPTSNPRTCNKVCSRAG